MNPRLLILVWLLISTLSAAAFIGGGSGGDSGVVAFATESGYTQIFDNASGTNVFVAGSADLLGEFAGQYSGTWAGDLTNFYGTNIVFGSDTGDGSYVASGPDFENDRPNGNNSATFVGLWQNASNPNLWLGNIPTSFALGTPAFPANSWIIYTDFEGQTIGLYFNTNNPGSAFPPVTGWQVWLLDGVDESTTPPQTVLPAMGTNFYTLNSSNNGSLFTTLRFWDRDANQFDNLAVDSGNFSFAGNVTANAFTGNGSGLTGLSTSYTQVTNTYGAFNFLANTNLVLNGVTVSTNCGAANGFAGCTGLTLYTTNVTPNSFQVFAEFTGGSFTTITNVLYIKYGPTFPFTPNTIAADGNNYASTLVNSYKLICWSNTPSGCFLWYGGTAFAVNTPYVFTFHL